VSTGEFAAAGVRRGASRPDFPSWATVRRCALALYFVALLLWSVRYGIPVQRELVILWICGALVCVSLGHPARQILQILLDWLPIVVVLFAYDMTRGTADSLGISAHTWPMIHFDEFVSGGQAPTVWIQEHIYAEGVVKPWDVAFAIVYTSHFIVPFATAGVLWARDRLAFLAFTKRLVTLAFAGLATYVAFPAAPPWMASEVGLIDEIARSTSKGWEVIGVGTASLFTNRQQSVNLVAAVPSLHAAFAALVAMFLWRRVSPWLRPVLAVYPLAMGFTLIATGEHYLFDVLLGFGYAGAVMAAWAWWERRRATHWANVTDSR
jgi:membrane-associated phospholipid phosphatase